MKRAQRAARGFVVGLFAVLACQTPGGPPRLVPVLGEETRVQGWLERCQSEAAGRERVRLVGKLNVDGPGGTGGAKQVILAARPSSLRFESLNPLGQTAALLVTDGERYTFYDGESLESGRVTASVLLERLGLDLEPEEAVQLLLGSPLGDGATLHSVHAVLGLGEDRVVNLDAHRLRFGREGELLGAVGLGVRGTVRWSLEYGSWREVPGGRYPFELVFHFPRSDLRAELDLKQVEINPELDPTLFRVNRGEGE